VTFFADATAADLNRNLDNIRKQAHQARLDVGVYGAHDPFADKPLPTWPIDAPQAGPADDVLAETFGPVDDYAPDVKVTIADEAKNIVAGARRSAYGKPEDNFARIAHLWTGYARAKGWPIEFAAADVSPLMRLMKEARIVESPDHRDSHVDLVGYALTGAEVNGVKA